MRRSRSRSPRDPGDRPAPMALEARSRPQPSSGNGPGARAPAPRHPADGRRPDPAGPAEPGDAIRLTRNRPRSGVRHDPSAASADLAGSPRRRSDLGRTVAGVHAGRADRASSRSWLFDGFRLFGGGRLGPDAHAVAPEPGASATPDRPSPSPSASRHRLAEPQRDPEPEPRARARRPRRPSRRRATPAPTAPPRPTPSQTRVVDPERRARRRRQHRHRHRQPRRAGPGQRDRGGRVRLSSLRSTSRSHARQYEDAAIDAEDLELRIGELAADGEMVPSASCFRRSASSAPRCRSRLRRE